MNQSPSTQSPFNTTQQFMNGLIYSLEQPRHFLCKDVNIFKTKQWVIVTLKKEDVIKIENEAKSIYPYEKSPFYREGKLFFPVIKVSQWTMWNSKKEVIPMDEVSTVKFQGQVKLVLSRYTKYNSVLSFKLDISGVMISDFNNVTCPCPFE